MNPYLAGIGIGIGQAGANVAAARKDREDRERQAARDALLERQVVVQEQRAAADEAARTTDVGALFKVLGLPLPEGAPTSVPTSSVNALMNRLTQKPARHVVDGRMIDDSGQVIYEPPAPAPITPPEGTRPVLSVDVKGRPSTRHEYLPEPKEPNQGQRNDARAAAILRDRGIPEGTREWNEGMFVLTNPTPTVPDVGIYSRLDVLGQVGKPRAPEPPTPRLPIDKRLTPEEAGSMGVPYGTTRSGATGGKPLLAAQRTKMDAQSSVLGMIDKMERDLSGVASPGTPLERGLAVPGRLYDVYGQADPKLSALHSRIGGTFALVVRALGEVGALTEGDITRAKNLQPVLAPIPDTDQVIQAKLKGLRELVQEVSSRTGSRPDAVQLGGPAGIGNTTVTPQTQPGGQSFQSLPPASQFTGKTARNPQTGQRMKSDGQKWVPVP